MARRRLRLYGALSVFAAVIVTVYIGILVATAGTRRASDTSQGSSPDVEAPSARRITEKLHLRRTLRLTSMAEDHTAHDSAADSNSFLRHKTDHSKPSGKAGHVSTARHLDNPRRYHIVTSAAGFANHWQIRVHYWWYKKQKAACELQDTCDMGGFTRLLHTGHADDLMDEVPTVVVDPLPEDAFAGKDRGYIVLNRPFAFLEWLSKASVPERYVLMAESDHLFMRPLPNMMRGEVPAAALFSYMLPADYPEILRMLLGDITDAQIQSIPRIGNSPTFLSVKDMRKVVPLWYNTTMQIWTNDKAHNAWNWILEMYGFTLATFRAGVHKDMLQSLNLLAHPPFDKKEFERDGLPYYILHLTYPMKYNAQGGMVDDEKLATYVLDKRRYSEQPPPRHLPAPPDNIDNDLLRMAVRMINEATDAIPCWDVYHQSKVVTDTCEPGVRALSVDSVKATQA